MTRQDMIWPMNDKEWEELMREYGRGKDTRKSFLWGLAICLVSWGIIGVCLWVGW